MPLPIHRIFWAGNDANHQDHLHVEGSPVYVGWDNGQGTQPPYYNPGQTEAVEAIYAAMEEGYGTGYYFTDIVPPEPNWSHMGWYNRRTVASSDRWSQHAWANALDIGPLYGVEAQEPIFDYLMNYEEDDMPTADEIRAIVREELDRATTGQAATKNSFYGIGGAVISTKIGKTGRTLGQIVQNTDNQLAKIAKFLGVP